MWLHKNLASVKNQVDKINSAPFLPKGIPVDGFVYDVELENLEIAQKEK